MTTDLRYPIGRFEPQPYSDALKADWMAAIRFLPNAIEQAVHNLDEAQLHTPYREGGWTVHELVHHVADSHMNAYIRCKFCYTEPGTSIKPYEENDWAKTADVAILPINISITLLFALHQRWTVFLESLAPADWQKTVFHPGLQKHLSLWDLLGMYAWHSRHHTAHITALRERMGW